MQRLDLTDAGVGRSGSGPGPGPIVVKRLALLAFGAHRVVLAVAGVLNHRSLQDHCRPLFVLCPFYHRYICWRVHCTCTVHPQPIRPSNRSISAARGLSESHWPGIQTEHRSLRSRSHRVRPKIGAPFSSIRTSSELTQVGKGGLYCGI